MQHAFVVDVQSSQGFSLGLTLEKAGYGVTVVADYAEVIARISKDFTHGVAPDVLILALDELGEQEARLVEWLVEEKLDVPLIVVTSISSSNLLKDFADENHWYYLEKPFSPEQILSTVELASNRA